MIKNLSIPPLDLVFMHVGPHYLPSSVGTPIFDPKVGPPPSPKG